MRAYLVVLDHPFASVSGKDGILKIDGLPTNTKLIFRVFHEAGKIDQVTINEQNVVWARSRFDVDLAPGLNDLGEILIPENALRAN